MILKKKATNINNFTVKVNRKLMQHAISLRMAVRPRRNGGGGGGGIRFVMGDVQAVNKRFTERR